MSDNQMKRIKLDERVISKAIQRYLNDQGYHVHKLEMVHDAAKNEFSAIAMVERD